MWQIYSDGPYVCQLSSCSHNVCELSATRKLLTTHQPGAYESKNAPNMIAANRGIRGKKYGPSQ